MAHHPGDHRVAALRFFPSAAIPPNAQPLTGDKKVLIGYLSRTNNTKAIAEFIHQKVGGTIVALELERPIGWKSKSWSAIAVLQCHRTFKCGH